MICGFPATYQGYDFRNGYQIFLRAATIVLLPKYIEKPMSQAIIPTIIVVEVCSGYSVMTFHVTCRTFTFGF